MFRIGRKGHRVTGIASLSQAISDPIGELGRGSFDVTKPLLICKLLSDFTKTNFILITEVSLCNNTISMWIYPTVGKIQQFFLYSKTSI